MRIEFLKKKLARLTEKRSNLTNKALASEDADEVRMIHDQIAEINEEVEEINDEIRSLEAAPPSNAQLINGGVVGSFANEQRAETDTESMEYRQAFMRYVTTGELDARSAGVAISTTDTAPAIPVTIMNEVINTVKKRYGNLYSKVRKISVPGGVDFPIGSLKATFKWINESTVSPRQKVDKLAKIRFTYHVAEIRVAQTFLSNLLTLSAFETALAEVIAIAYMEAMDDGIVNGSGEGCMLGITKDARVTNYVEMKAADMGNWMQWRKKFFAKLPLGYRDGEFIFPLSTVETYLETMADSNGNPVFRQATGLEVNDGDAQNPNGRFFGREISLVEPEIIKDYDTANDGDIIGIYWQPLEYAINENFGFTMTKYFDQETNEWVDKALVVCDGKVLNPNGIWLIKKDV